MGVPAKKGIHRVAWDLRYPYTGAVSSAKLPEDPHDAPKGYLAPPGDYTATLVKLIDGVDTELSQPQAFTVKRMRDAALEGSPLDATAAFWRTLEDVNLDLGATKLVIDQTKEQLKLMDIALSRSQSAPGTLDKKLHAINTQLEKMSKQTSGDPLRAEVGEKSKLTIGSRLWIASMGTAYSTYGPTPTHQENLAIAKKQLSTLRNELTQIVENDIPALQEEMKKAKAPSVKGGGLR